MQKLKEFLKKNTSVLLILSAVVLGALIGLTGKSLSDTTREFISSNIIGSFQTIFIKLVGYIAAPLIFVTITTSIYKMGTLKTFFGRGRRYLLSFILIMMLVGAIVSFVALPVFGLTIESNSVEANSFKEVLNILKNFLPKNLWDPFLKINLVQVDVLAICAGITLLALNKNADDLVKFLNKIAKLLIKIMRIVAMFVPLYVLAAIIGIIWNNGAGSLGGIYKLLLLFFGFSILFNLVMLLISALYHKTSIKKLFLASFNPFIRALTTANSTVAMPNQFESAKKLGISKTESSFGIPLAISFFKVPSNIYLTLVATYYFSLTHSSVSIIWIVLEVILCTLLTISIAPVSGGGISNYHMLVRELTIDPMYLGIMIALDPIVDFFITGLNTFSQPIQLANVSSRNKELNHNILRDKKVVLVCGAMDVETDWIIDQLSDKSEDDVGGYKSFKGKINNNDVVVLVTDIGMDNAFKSTSAAIKAYEPTELISIGTSGGHHKDIFRGDIVISNKLINYDDSKEALLEANKEYMEKFLNINNSRVGTILTSDTWHKTVEEITEIHNKTNSDVEEMESYVSCKLASEKNINFIALRIVSNNAITNQDYIRETGIELQKQLFNILNK
ncbi:MAG: cation:dicarboxylase symporter family transporter [Bacilli bacterium]|nr:cation:dicarboxylase symporter family transporter [Bacilli bacterium]